MTIISLIRPCYGVSLSQIILKYYTELLGSPDLMFQIQSDDYYTFLGKNLEKESVPSKATKLENTKQNI